MGDTHKKEEKDVFSKFSAGLRNAPNTIFDDVGQSSHEKEETPSSPVAPPTGLENIQHRLQEYMDEKPRTIADGVFKGLLSIGSGVVSGITGIVSEPIREVQKKGAIGVVTGVGKGLSGLVTKPLAGVIDMGVKTTQGVINTPGTLTRAAAKGFSSFDTPPAPPENPIFGVPHDVSLKNAEKMNIVHPSVSVLAQIRKVGLDMVGIFRESGNVSVIKSIVDNYDIGKEPNLQELDMRELTGIMKYYLRTLPEPLLTFDLYSQFLTVLRSKNPPDRSATLYKSIIRSLPNGDRVFLQLLLHLLSDIAKNQENNKMTISNLAIVFGPSLLRPRSVDAASELFDMPDVSKVIDFLITRHVELF